MNKKETPPQNVTTLPTLYAVPIGLIHTALFNCKSIIHKRGEFVNE